MDEINEEPIQKDLEFIEEGLVRIAIPKFNKVSSQAPVFYNPKMEFNRDISILALETFVKEIAINEKKKMETSLKIGADEKNKEISVCDLFGGSGIRGIRYQKEVRNIDKVHVNDISSLAIKFGKINSAANDIIIEFHQKEANILLRENRGKFDIVDVDPFGTPSYFIDSLGYSAKKESMVCITATDTSALCGTYKEPCIRKYNALPYKSEYCHENGIRILIGFVALTLGKYKKYIEVKLSHSSEHYMRLYLKIKKGSAPADESLKENIGYIIHCPECLYRNHSKGLSKSLSKSCPICRSILTIAGPLWTGPLGDKEFIKNMLSKIPHKKINTEKSVIKLLNLCHDESNAPITFYDVHKLCKVMKISAPKLDEVLSSLRDMGYLAIRTHFNPLGIKTDCDIKTLKLIVNSLSVDSDV